MKRLRMYQKRLNQNGYRLRLLPYSDTEYRIRGTDNLGRQVWLRGNAKFLTDMLRTDWLSLN